ncbi:hypothetical protein CI109_106117 [Kwoniella shandongensis]|uniref:Uncharacterized protein n=1 Tax=Kwoniella shandongensis TaxID=1734106 RepID=A0A5M6BQU5_9TREE|nr:uncharacterized protein CI109_006345 [Kwoniella shandongensis]KAA5525274.1 hypothetical protein CI109_006345 [Kwoniella shandongensis]
MASTSTAFAPSNFVDTSFSLEPSSSSPSSPYRISRLPPHPTVPQAGPSRSPQRYLFFAVRRGHRTGVFTEWHQAERQVYDHPDPCLKSFSTKLAAEAFVNGWDGAGRHSLPPSTPKPLREHLAMSFPGSVNVPSPSPARRQSYHARLLTTAPPPPISEFPGDFSPSPIDTTNIRPSLSPSRSSYRHSMVKISSPLRQQVADEDTASDESEGKSGMRPLKKASSFIGAGGLLSPPQSPDKLSKRLSVMDRERPTQRRAMTESGTWASRGHRDFTPSDGLGLYSPPLSPPTSPTGSLNKRMSTSTRPARPASGLWADLAPKAAATPSSPLSPTKENEEVLFTDPSAPKFSRSGLKKSKVVMPVAAKRQSSSLGSLKGRSSATSLFSGSPNVSTSSLSSTNSDKSLRRSSTSQYQDRLSSLAETSKRELQLNEEGLLALSSLSPPKPAFMRRSSSHSSIASTDSADSMGSLTSASSTLTSSLESCEPISEECEGDMVEIRGAGDSGFDVAISCTKSDGDADGSVDSGSMRKEKVKKTGGMFKRLAKALKLEKKSVVGGQDISRRGSL